MTPTASPAGTPQASPISRASSAKSSPTDKFSLDGEPQDVLGMTINLKKTNNSLKPDWAIKKEKLATRREIETKKNYDEGDNRRMVSHNRERSEPQRNTDLTQCTMQKASTIVKASGVLSGLLTSLSSNEAPSSNNSRKLLDANAKSSALQEDFTKSTSSHSKEASKPDPTGGGLVLNESAMNARKAAEGKTIPPSIKKKGLSWLGATAKKIGRPVSSMREVGVGARICDFEKSESLDWIASCDSLDEFSQEEIEEIETASNSWRTALNDVVDIDLIIDSGDDGEGEGESAEPPKKKSKSNSPKKSKKEIERGEQSCENQTHTALH